VALHNGEAVGMGRIVGDGYIYFYFQDIAVKQEHQGNGIGRRLLNRMMRYMQEHAPDQAFAGIFASSEGMRLYERYGFRREPGLTGMFRVMTATRNPED